MGKTIQLYTDESKTEKGYPITSSGSVFHGNKTVSSEIEGLKSKNTSIESEISGIDTSVTKLSNDITTINAAIVSGVGTTEAAIQPTLSSSDTSTVNGVSAKGIIDYVAEQKELIGDDIDTVASRFGGTSVKSPMTEDAWNELTDDGQSSALLDANTFYFTYEDEA